MTAHLAHATLKLPSDLADPEARVLDWACDGLVRPELLGQEAGLSCSTERGSYLDR